MKSFLSWLTLLSLTMRPSIFTMAQQPCIDSSTFTFGSYPYQGTDVIRNCEWLVASTAEINLRRQNNWCSETFNGSSISNKCRSACSICVVPSKKPSQMPTQLPTASPTIRSSPMSLTVKPSVSPSKEITVEATSIPSGKPTMHPTGRPSKYHPMYPSSQPSNEHSLYPTVVPTPTPTNSVHPSIVSSSLPSSKPSSFPFAAPSNSPSYAPTKLPSPTPSASPSYSLQNIELFIIMDFDNIKEFNDDETKQSFEKVTDIVLKEILENHFVQTSFLVSTKIIEFPPVDTEELRQTLQSYDDNILRVSMSVQIEVRYETKLRAFDLIKVIIDAFDSHEEQRVFIILLQEVNSKVFGPINFMTKFKINDEELIITRINSSALTYIGVGVGIGVAGVVFFVFLAGFAFVRKRKNAINSSQYDRSHYSSPLHVDPRISS
jgi:hypothetical protein